MSLADKRGDFLEKAQEALEAVFGGEMVYDGESFTVARSGDAMAESPEMGGYEDEAVVLVRVRLAHVPEAGLEREELVSLDGETLRVVSCLREIGDVAWSVELAKE